MIGITDIASYVPLTAVSNLERAEAAGKTRDFVENKIGFRNVTRMAAGEDTSDLCVRAFEALAAKRRIDKPSLDCLVVCTQNPDGHGLPHTSAVVHAKLGLRREVACFDVSLGCSGYVYSLGIALSFMRENGLKHGLLFTADPYSKILDPRDYDTELLFGDAATVTYLSEQPAYRALRSRFATDGGMRHSIQIPPGTDRLSMLGGNVFKFTMTAVPGQVEECLAANGLGKEDIDLYLLHQGSKYIVDNMSKKLGVPAAKAPFLAADVGNTVSSTIPLMLERYLGDGPRRILICGFGVGLSWATSVLERT
jgi:3-oxoacyl-[acyl-carrier-protein] synthase III